MKKIIKLTESDLKRIVGRVIKEYDEKTTTTGKYYTLSGYYFYVNDDKMYLAEKKDGKLSPNLMTELPTTKEISVIWSKDTKESESNDPKIKGKELENFKLNSMMENAKNIGENIKNKNEAIANFSKKMIPIVFYSHLYGAPALGGFAVTTDFPDGGEGKLRTIEGVAGNVIHFQKSCFKASKEYGILIEVVMHGQPIDLKDFGVSKSMLESPVTFNIGEWFNENEAEPKNLESAPFLDKIKNHIKSGGKINKITIDASTSKMPAGHMNNDKSKNKWKELNEYNDVVMGNNDDGTGNLQLCKHKAMNTYKALKRAIPELASAPYVLKASGPVGEYVHIKFE
jgi:hypothetical protein